MLAKMGRLLLFLGLAIALILPAGAQDAAGYLLPRINNLRASKGLPAYGIHPALTAAANNHARWMAATGKIQHVQDDGSGPRNRAQNAGFPTNWVSENIYKGSSSNPAVAWNWWLNSPIHYTGIVSPNYDQIGISSASGAHGYAFVTVFGNSTGRLPQAAASSGGGVAAPAAPPSYVLGIDEWGNIKHEIQAGQTMGDIALIYGYTWEDIPYMLELNGMTEDEIRLLQPGDVFLVPPQDGTFTPTAEAPPATATATPSATATASETRAATATAIPTRAATLVIRAGGAATAISASDEEAAGQATAELLLLGAAILVQVLLLGGASLALIQHVRS